MLIKEELESYTFSQAESLAVRYIINHVEELEKISIQALAKETFTQPSTIVRIAKKLGFKGWVDFKHAYHVLLDILYGLVFSSYYDENLNHLKRSGQLIDRRFSATQLMEEEK
ncbi:MurR/RpiR family transcriptional regulator [Streptococcus hongkongensis]|nr:hypothetical protein NC01_09695 [Streptococcus uberis]